MTDDTTRLMDGLTSNQTPLPRLELDWLLPPDEAASRDTAAALMNRRSADSAFNGLGYRAGQAMRVSRETYWFFLEVVPPLVMTGPSFAVGERATEDLVDTFHEIGESYYCVTARWCGPASLSQAWSALLHFRADVERTAEEDRIAAASAALDSGRSTFDGGV